MIIQTIQLKIIKVEGNKLNSPFPKTIKGKASPEKALTFSIIHTQTKHFSNKAEDSLIILAIVSLNINNLKVYSSNSLHKIS